MEIRFDWPKIYESVLFETTKNEKLAQSVARRITQTMEEDGTPAGESLGTSPDLCERFGIGKETLIEATRLLEDRGIAQMRRGARGGLIALARPAHDPAAILRRYLPDAGMSIDQIVEARRAIELLHIYHYHVRNRQSAQFERLFHTLILDTGSPLAKPLPSGPWSGGKLQPCLQPFQSALDAMLSAKEMPVDNDCARYPGLIGLSADFLTGEAARLRRLGIEKLGSEQQLAERIGVSRQVLRQAMRLLEDKGLLTCRRGRSNGIVTATAHPANIVRGISDAFAKQGLGENEFRDVLAILDRVNRTLFASKANSLRFDRLQHVIAHKDWQKPATHIRRMHIEWPVLDNPALSLLEQSLSAYRSRRAGPRIFVALCEVDLLQQKAHRHVELMRARNFVGADRHYTDMHGHIAGILGRH